MSVGILALLLGVGSARAASPGTRECRDASIEIPSYRFEVSAADGKPLPRLVAGASIVVETVTNGSEPLRPDRLIPLAVELDPATSQYFTPATRLSLVCPEALDRVVVRFNVDGTDEPVAGAALAPGYEGRWVMVLPRPALPQPSAVLPLTLFPRGTRIGTVRWIPFFQHYEFRELRWSYYLNGEQFDLDPATLGPDDRAVLDQAARSGQQIMLRGSIDWIGSLLFKVTEIRVQPQNSIGAELSK